MPSTTLSLLLAGLALSSQIFLITASPVTWYAAPTPSSTTSKAATTSSLSSTASSPSSTTTSPTYLSLLSLSARYPSRISTYGSTPDPITYTGTESEAFKGLYYAGKTVCPESTLPEAFRALSVKERELQGVGLSETFYRKHQGLRKYCGKQIELRHPSNSSSPSFTYTITRGTPADFAPGAGPALLEQQLFEVGREWGWSERAMRQIQAGGLREEAEFRFL